MQNETPYDGAAELSINRLASLTSTQRHQNPDYIAIQAAESSTEILNEIVEEKKPKTREELLAERALKRADRKAATREKSDGFKRAVSGLVTIDPAGIDNPAGGRALSSKKL